MDEEGVGDGDGELEVEDEDEEGGNEETADVNDEADEVEESDGRGSCEGREVRMTGGRGLLARPCFRREATVEEEWEYVVLLEGAVCGR